MKKNGETPMQEAPQPERKPEQKPEQKLKEQLQPELFKFKDEEDPFETSQH